jgi:hypothetical protein
MVGIMTYRKEHPRERRKVYWAGRSSSNDLGRGDGFQRKGSYGIHPGNESRNHSGCAPLCTKSKSEVPPEVPPQFRMPLVAFRNPSQLEPKVEGA